jgi:hypothetical protein
MSKQNNPFGNYVQERLQIMAINQEEHSRESTKQGVTVRLDPGVVRAIDQIAKELDQSRQVFLVELIRTGLHEVIKAYADSCGDKAQEVYREFQDLMSFKEGDLQ